MNKVTKVILKNDNGPTITATAKDEPTPEIEINLKPASLPEVAKAILEQTLKNPRVDTQDDS